MAWSGVLLVAVLVAGAVAPAVPALTAGHRPAPTRSVVAAPHAPAARPVTPSPERQHVAVAPRVDVHGVLRSTRLLTAGVDVDTGAFVAAALAVTGTPVAAVVANALSLVAAGTGPLVSARHQQGHLRT